MFNIVMTYLSEDDEVRVVTQTTSRERPKPQRVLDGARHPAVPGDGAQVLVAEDVARYAVRLVDASRPGPRQREARDFVD